MTKTAETDLYPITIIQDPHRGATGGGRWIAVAEADQMVYPLLSRHTWVLLGMDGPGGDVARAREFWCDPPWWCAAGPTPDAAISALVSRWMVQP